jgi:DNA-binding transcriptional MerR regulator
MSESIERFSVAEIERRTGVARRTLQFWSDNGVLVSVADRHSGSGNPRYYSREELGIAALLGLLFALGVTVGILRRTAEILRAAFVIRQPGTVLVDDEMRAAAGIGRALLAGRLGQPAWLLLAHRPPDVLLIEPRVGAEGEANFAEILRNFTPPELEGETLAVVVLDLTVLSRLEC